MGQPFEFVVQVKRWPAYTLRGLIPVMVLTYGFLVGFFLWAGVSVQIPGVTAVTFAAAALIGLIGSIQVALKIKVARQASQMIRYPPRLSAEGIRLWLFPTSEYVLLPWPRVIAVRTAVKGSSLGLFVEVHAAENLAGSDPAKVRRIRRMMRRFDGSPFVYAIQASPHQLAEIDQAVQQFSGRRLFLAAPSSVMRHPGHHGE